MQKNKKRILKIIIGFEEKALCRKIANVFEYAGKKGCDTIEFVCAWMNSKVADNIYIRDFKDIAQNYVYLFNSLMLERKIELSGKVIAYTDILFWLGYMVTYLEFFLELSPKELWEQYDIVRYAQNYEVLHTLSSKNAAEEFISEYKKCLSANLAESGKGKKLWK